MYAGKACATIERIVTHPSYAIGDYNRGKLFAIKERHLINTYHIIRYSDRGKVGAPTESTVTNPLCILVYRVTTHSIICDTHKYCVGVITDTYVSAKFILRIERWIATIEHILSQDLYVITHYNRGKAVATKERPITNTRHAIGYYNGGKAGATSERRIINTCHG